MKVKMSSASELEVPARCGTVHSKEEFKTVQLIIESNAKTQGVDAFALALIKSERQIRRLVTHLVYQFPCFDSGDINELRDVLCKNHAVYFEGFEQGFNALYPRSVKALVGANYDRLHERINAAIEYRNKIFHGQLTPDRLSREGLLGFVSYIRCWCDTLARSAQNEFGYDGFARNSFQKSKTKNLSTKFQIQFTGIDCYTQFIKKYMQRNRKILQTCN